MRRPLIVLVSTVALVVLYGADWEGPVRVVVAFWFLLVCPGLAWIPLFPGTSRDAELALVIALSLALDTAVVTTQLALGLLSPAGSLVMLGGICGAGCTLQLRPGRG